ncbi:MAG: DNA adenine methylase [Acidimicrobiia bacterium]|nr:DNA adenine methylase [Acidimicrobiia bacterium]
MGDMGWRPGESGKILMKKARQTVLELDVDNGKQGGVEASDYIDHGKMADRIDPIRLHQIEVSPIPAVNVASVPQRSPLRYPGGKTWLIPHIRAWLETFSGGPPLLLEPFAGGGIVSLTAVMEHLVDRCLMVELDRDVAAFWHAALRHGDALAEKVLCFTPTREAVNQLMERPPDSVVEHGFRTLVLNRTRRGGILAPGASFSRAGENGRGLASRWYPETIARRLGEITKHANRITFCEADGMQLLAALLGERGEGIVLFVDPPYTAGGKRAGKRLYAHNDIDHLRLFQVLAESNADFLMTYDLSYEVVTLVREYGFHAVQVTMKNTHHARVPELVVTARPVFNT